MHTKHWNGTGRKAINNFNYENWNDWYLPSHAELQLALCEVELSCYNCGNYIWTSTQHEGSSAINYAKARIGCSQYERSKNNQEHVIPMRTHDITQSWNGTACISNVVVGCVLESACNFNPSATVW